MNNFRIPVSVIDDFWFDPHSLVDYSKTLTFNGPSENQQFPGVRCDIEEKNPELFSSMINSVLSMFVDVNERQPQPSAAPAGCRKQPGRPSPIAILPRGAVRSPPRHAVRRP